MQVQVITSNDFEADASIVERGKATFLEVGDALARIRDSRSYAAAGYATFEACCTERFGFSRSRGYQLMAAAKQVKALPPKMSTRVDKPAKTSVKVTEKSLRAERLPSQAPVRIGLSKAMQVKGNYDRTGSSGSTDGAHRCPNCGHRF